MRLKPLPSILIVSDSLQVGGAERHVVALACRLAARGYDFVSPARPVVRSCTTPLRDVAVTVLCDELVKRRVSPEFADAIGAEIERSPDRRRARPYVRERRGGSTRSDLSLRCVRRS